ncbi:hypothetical protein GCM10027037_23540 [Mucilaginibacter koreensis]
MFDYSLADFADIFSLFQPVGFDDKQVLQHAKQTNNQSATRYKQSNVVLEHQVKYRQFDGTATDADLTLTFH